VIKTNSDINRRGFRSASVIARLAGEDPIGSQHTTGQAIFVSNPEMISTTLKIFNMVLDAGPDGTVINMLGTWTNNCSYPGQITDVYVK
jgi:hypothetical protein